MGQFLPGDLSKGDPNTLGGYVAVHSRPAAFEGADGASYSAEIVTDPAPESGEGAVAGYLLFVRWREGDPVASGHVETDYLATGPEADVLREIGALTLQDVRRLLDPRLEQRSAGRPWWEAMREGSDEA
ncbi:MAG: hypothetical protein ACSLFE_06450 [Gemmatimonadaceae bacterium]